MDEETWDGEAFRQRMAARAADHERYINEHKERLRRGQTNGSKFTHDQWLGEWWVYYRLAGLIVSDTREGLIAELKDLASHYPTISGAFDQDSAKSGYMMAIRGLLNEQGEDMPTEK